MVSYGGNKALKIIRLRNDGFRRCHLGNLFSTFCGVRNHPGLPRNGHLIGGFQISPILKNPGKLSIVDKPSICY